MSDSMKQTIQELQQRITELEEICRQQIAMIQQQNQNITTLTNILEARRKADSESTSANVGAILTPAQFEQYPMPAVGMPEE